MFKNKGWYGFDLDCTLAFYDHWRGETHIGEPIVRMVEKVKELIAEGHEVKIFTARVAEAEKNKDDSIHDVAIVIKTIEEWCEKHIGQKLPVTNKKDFGMIALYDDRAVQVLPNQGLEVEALGGQTR